MSHAFANITIHAVALCTLFGGAVNAQTTFSGPMARSRFLHAMGIIRVT